MSNDRKLVIGFDMDGTLDIPAVRDLAAALAVAGHEVHVITGMFPQWESPWQDEAAKYEKFDGFNLPKSVHLHIIEALPVQTDRNIDYVLRELNLRKGDLCRRLGVSVMIEDSSLCATMKAMCGTTVLRIQ